MLLWLWHTGELQHEQHQGVLDRSSLLVPPCCLPSQDILLIFSRPMTPWLVPALHNSLTTMPLYMFTISPLQVAPCCGSPGSHCCILWQMQDHTIHMRIALVQVINVLSTHGVLTNLLCGAMQLLWILGPIALLIATIATLLCFFWMDFLPTPSRAQLHLLKSDDEHE